MILTVPLQADTVLGNVRYKWIAAGVEGSALSAGITQPDVTYPVFRFDIEPPVGAEELIVYDDTDATNWNVGGYRLAVATAQTQASLGSGISPDLQRLKAVVAAYLRRAQSELTVDGVDLFLMAANNARRNAELMHDFEYARVVATVPLVAAGVSLDTATIIQGVATAGLKSIVGVRRLGTNGYSYPLDFTRRDIATERDRSELELRDDWWVTRRYPSDADVLNFYGTNSAVVQQGNMLLLYPGFSSLDPTSVTIYIDGYGWLPNYGSVDPVTDPEDFLVKYGFAYLQWATLCELNNIFQSYVPRQEGSLPPPTDQRDAAWKALVLWDAYLVDSSLTRSA